MAWTWLRSCYGFNMRVWVGGIETIYPARWFFCDPEAEWFASPRGAEAAPWLKQYEVNEDWGDDGTIKKLDRGINPGYPGRCSVGDPQWFIDGRLPADFLDGLTPTTPPCCGHTPPPNPDPRCPPVRTLVPCPFCSDGFCYTEYTLTLTGITGPGAALNGTWRMTLVEVTPLGYRYENNILDDLGMGILATGILVGDNSLPPIGSGNAIGWKIDPPADCTRLPLTMEENYYIGGGSSGFAVLT